MIIYKYIKNKILFVDKRKTIKRMERLGLFLYNIYVRNSPKIDFMERKLEKVVQKIKKFGKTESIFFFFFMRFLYKLTVIQYFPVKR
jgi:hypothetical protein